jgi:lactate dehydrogenase-like 2-hydroxyacid dehydrogenase
MAGREGAQELDASSGILALVNVHERTIVKLSEYRKVHRFFDMSREEQNAFLVSDAAQSIVCILTNGHKGASSDIISALPNLKLIACYGVGVDAVDLQSGQFISEFVRGPHCNDYFVLITFLTFASAKSHGVVVTNTPDVLSDCVADLAIGLCIGLARKICQSDAFVRSGTWVSGQTFPLGTKFSGKRMGILGMGRVGQEIAARASAFKMTVSYHTRKKAAVPYTYHETLIDMAKNCDFLGNPPCFTIYHLIVNAVFQSSLFLEAPLPFTSSTVPFWMHLGRMVFSLM